MYVNSSARLDDIFSALAHKKRRGILHTLSFRPATVKQLAYEQSLSLPAMHKHMNLLVSAKLVDRKKVGRTNFVALNKQTMKSTQDWLLQYNAAWGNNQETLENYIANL